MSRAEGMFEQRAVLAEEVQRIKRNMAQQEQRMKEVGATSLNLHCWSWSNHLLLGSVKRGRQPCATTAAAAGSLPVGHCWWDDEPAPWPCACS
jgi:hypothetical protein